MNSKIGVKLLTSYVILVIVTLLIAASLLNPLFKSYLTNSKTRELTHKANEVATLARTHYTNSLSNKSFDEVLVTVDKFIDTRFLIIDRNGIIVASSIIPEKGRRLPIRKGTPSRLFSDQIEKQVLSGETIIKEGTSPYFSTPLISVAVPINIKEPSGQSQVAGAVMVYSPVYQVTDIIKSTYYYLGISSIIAILLATVLAYYYSRKISLPLNNMNKAALSMAQGNYKTTIEKISDDELGELADSLNHLANQLDLNVTALQQEKSKLESVVDSINEGLIAINKEGFVILANPMIERIFVSNAESLLGKPLGEISPHPQLTSVFIQVLKEGTPTSTIIKLVHSTYQVIAAPIQAENSSPFGTVGILQDISEFEKLEQLRRDFIANVSHELRAPITVIRGYTDCLLDGVTDHDPPYYYQIIKSETLRLERLIKDLMDLSLLQSGKAELHLEKVNLSTLTAKTTDNFHNMAALKGVKLRNIVDVQGNIHAYCDGDRIEQLIIILLDNAIKYTKTDGCVEVNLEDRPDKISLSIKDSGIGIPPEDIPYIWERFYKVDKSRNRRTLDGTGLGLSIAKQIAEMHHAELTVDSCINKGSIFTLVLKK